MNAISKRLVLFVCLGFVTGCDLRTPRKATSNEDLVEMVKNGDLESARLTIDADKALANAKRADGISLLYFAAANGHKDIVTYLLDMGAGIDERIDYGSALHVAAENEYVDIVRILLDRGADSNLRDDWKQTPLHNTTQNQHAAVARMLIDSGSDINARDHKGRTPLHRCKSLEVAQLLVTKGVNVNVVDDSGYTPLHWAATPREIVDKPTIEYFLAQGADVSLADKSGLTPRQLAVKNTQTALVAILDAHKP